MSTVALEDSQTDLSSHPLDEASLHLSLSLPSPAHRAKAVAPLMMKSFTERLGIMKSTPLTREEKEKTAPYGPSSWSVDGDEELRKELERELKRVGVLGELCEVGLSNWEERKVVDAAWKRFFQVLWQGVQK